VDVVRVVGDERDPGARSGERARRVGHLPEDGCADDEQGVIRGQALAQPAPLRRQYAGEQRVILRKAGARAERLLEDRGGEAVGQLDQCRPCRRVVRARSDDERRRDRAGEERRERIDRRGLDGQRAEDRAAERRGLPLLVRRLVPVAHRDDHESGPTGGGRGVERALDRCGNVLRADGLLDTDRILAAESRELSGEERLEGEVAAVLLADHDDERRPVHPGRRERADRSPEPRGRVQEDERRLVPADREAGRETDDGSLVEAEHEAEVVRQPGEERNLRRPGVGEHRRQVPPAEDVEGGVPNRLPGACAGRHAWSHVYQDPGRVRSPCVR
jgi:hypothetical protein